MPDQPIANRPETEPEGVLFEQRPLKMFRKPGEVDFGILVGASP